MIKIILDNALVFELKLDFVIVSDSDIEYATTTFKNLGIKFETCNVLPLNFAPVSRDFIDCIRPVRTIITFPVEIYPDDNKKDILMISTNTKLYPFIKVFGKSNNRFFIRIEEDDSCKILELRNNTIKIEYTKNVVK